jgi:DNA-binding LacI/PurR family transcriptional regulator
MARARIRALCGCSDKTIVRYPRVRDVSRERIEEAADQLGIALPGRRAR